MYKGLLIYIKTLPNDYLNDNVSANIYKHNSLESFYVLGN